MTPPDQTSSSEPVYECDLCGACCRTWRILVSHEDAQRQPRIRAEAKQLPDHQATVLWRFQLFPLPFHEACCFLDAADGNRCDIYATRPRVCRQFAAGSERCQEARQQQGLTPLRPSSGQCP